MDGIKEMLDRLSELDEGQLSDLESKIIDEFETVEKQEPTAQVVDSMTALADALDAVRGEQQNRVAAQKDLETACRRGRFPRQAAGRGRARRRGGCTARRGRGPARRRAAPPRSSRGPAAPEGEAPPEERGPDGEEETRRRRRRRLLRRPSPRPTRPRDEPDRGDDAPPTRERADRARERAWSARERARAARATSRTTQAEADDAGGHSGAGGHRARRNVTPIRLPSNEEIPVAASATDVVVTPPAENRPVPREHASVAITAGADIPGISAGTELSSVTPGRLTPSSSVCTTSHASRQPNGQQYTVATLTASFPEDRVAGAGRRRGELGQDPEGRRCRGHRRRGRCLHPAGDPLRHRRRRLDRHPGAGLAAPLHRGPRRHPVLPGPAAARRGLRRARSVSGTRWVTRRSNVTRRSTARDPASPRSRATRCSACRSRRPCSKP